jgi:hypothetical protein
MATSPPNNSQSPNAPTDGIIQALGNAFKSQTGGVLNNVQIAKLLQANIGQLGQLAKDGKLSQQQILQVKKNVLVIFESWILMILCGQQLKDFADRHRAGQPQNGGPAIQVNAAAGP